MKRRLANPPGDQTDLFGSGATLPEGFRYLVDLISEGEEASLVATVRELPLKEFDFHGYQGKRRVISFGWRYDFAERSLEPAGDIPAPLLPLRRKAAAFADMEEGDLQQTHVIEYGPGAGIGWHRDKAVFGDVVGVSFLSPCRFRLRRKAGASWERASLTLAPRSAYLLRGPSRTEWEHSIPAVDQLRYSITFRNLLDPGPRS